MNRSTEPPASPAEPQANVSGPAGGLAGQHNAGRRGDGPQVAGLQVGESDRQRMFGMAINRLTLAQAARRVLLWCASPADGPCRYVVTPNVDHAVMFQNRPDLRRAYAKASLILADGAPLIAASRLLGRPLPERVAGSDLTPLVFREAGRVLAEAGRPSGAPLRVFLFGAAPGVAERAGQRIVSEHPAVEVAGTWCPPLGFEHVPAENDRALAAIADASPDLLIVGLGAPKQELWASRFHERIQAKVALCVGATIDFLAGHKRRSPLWLQRAGLEWTHRLATEPRRLAARYAKDAVVFPRLVWREWRRPGG